MYTEDAAKTKWCPMVRFQQNTFDERASGIECIASGCMMWRWSLNAYGLVSSKYGYCGLAGKGE